MSGRAKSQVKTPRLREIHVLSAVTLMNGSGARPTRARSAIIWKKQKHHIHLIMRAQPAALSDIYLVEDSVSQTKWQEVCMPSPAPLRPRLPGRRGRQAWAVPAVHQHRTHFRRLGR